MEGESSLKSLKQTADDLTTQFSTVAGIVFFKVVIYVWEQTWQVLKDTDAAAVMHAECAAVSLRNIRMPTDRPTRRCVVLRRNMPNPVKSSLLHRRTRLPSSRHGTFGQKQITKSCVFVQNKPGLRKCS